MLAPARTMLARLAQGFPCALPILRISEFVSTKLFIDESQENA